MLRGSATSSDRREMIYQRDASASHPKFGVSDMQHRKLGRTVPQ